MELERLAGLLRVEPDDYDEGGILHCGKCRQPKQAWIDWVPDAEGNRAKRLVPIMCKCDEEAEAREKARQKQLKFDERIKRLRSTICGGALDFTKVCFDMDEEPESPISRTCRSYVARWTQMAAENMGIIFYGDKGTGKSFYAACIVNALAEKGVTTAFTTTAALMQRIHKWDAEEILEAVRRVQLLVLDDFGAERDTSYGVEVLYNVINERCKTKKPTIITTNLSLNELRADNDIYRGRMNDRIVEMCPITLRMSGDSRRVKIAEERRRKARELLASCD